MPIGSAMLMQAGNNLVTMADGSVWLRTGVLAPAASYPLAAQRAPSGAQLWIDQSRRVWRRNCSPRGNGRRRTLHDR